VEWAFGDSMAKYLTKYAMKGVDMAFVAVGKGSTFAYDEMIQIFLARYQTSQEAMMSILGEPLTRLSHNVIFKNYNNLFMILLLGLYFICP